MEKAKANKPSLREIIIQSLLISAAVSFAMYILIPSCLYAGNQQEFPVTYGRMIAATGLAAVSNTLSLALVLSVLRKLCDALGRALSGLLFGFIAAFFVQSVFFNSRDIAFSGDREVYLYSTPKVIANAVVYVVILLIFTLLPLIFREDSTAGKIGRRLIKEGAAAVLAVEAVWLAVVMIPFKPELHDTYTGYLSYKPSMSLSEDENIAVFIVDRLDGVWLDKMLEDFPELSENLDGFTFYQNNVAHNTNTFPSVVQMLTGKIYDSREWPLFMRDAWSGNTLPSALKGGGYDINILPDAITTVSNTRLVSEQCDNIEFAAEGEYKYRYLGQYGIIHTMAKLSAARVAPYRMKGLLARGLGSNVGRYFLDFSSLPDYHPGYMDPASDLRYMDYLKSSGLTADNEHKTFSFVHLSGVHTKSNELAALHEEPTGKADFFQSARGDFEIIYEYMRQLKELGLYDKTTIIILGDHGRAPDEIKINKHSLVGAITTALLIKPKDSRGELEFDRYSELSNDFLTASVLQYAGIDHSDFGISYQDVIENDLHPERYFLTIQFRGYGRLLFHDYYKITGDARDFNNWLVIEDD